MPSRMSLAPALLAALFLAACAAPPVRRTDLRRPADVAEGLQRYYDERLYPAEGGYRHRQQVYGFSGLPVFYDAQGATVNAAWAREANTFSRIGLFTGLALVGVGAGLSVNAPANDPAKNAWWVSLLPAGFIGWTFHWAGDGWFRKPSVALYNKRLAERMGIQVLPAEEAP